MTEHTKYYLVAAEALPAVFISVAEAKRLLETGESKTIGEAVRAAGISRSAFYKYKDAVLPFYDMAGGGIVTFSAVLKDLPGVLSGLLGIFAASGANILTINQSIPTNGHAPVTVSASTAGLNCPVEQLLQRVLQQPGVIRFEIIAG